MAIVLWFAILTVAGLANGRNFNLQNNLGYTVWVGILGNAGKGQPDNGGFALNPGEHVSKGQESFGCGIVLPEGRNYTEATGKSELLLLTAVSYNNNYLFFSEIFRPLLQHDEGYTLDFRKESYLKCHKNYVCMYIYIYVNIYIYTCKRTNNHTYIHIRTLDQSHNKEILLTV